MALKAPRIGISSASFFHRMDIEDVVSDLGAHRIPIAELFLNTFSEYEEGFVSLLAERARAAGLTIYSVHPMGSQFEPQLFSIHHRQRVDALRIFERVLRAAKQLNASCYVMHGAAHLSGAAKNLQPDRVVPIFADLCAMARGYGVTLTLENVSWGMFRTPDYGLRLSDRLGDALHYTLDVKQAVRGGHTPADYIEAVGELIANLHLCDYRRAADGTWKWLLPGRGDCDFAGVFTRLAQKGYGGPAFVEVYSDSYGDLSELYEGYRAFAGRFGSVSGDSPL